MSPGLRLEYARGLSSEFRGIDFDFCEHMFREAFESLTSQPQSHERGRGSRTRRLIDFPKLIAFVDFKIIKVGEFESFKYLAPSWGVRMKSLFQNLVICLGMLPIAASVVAEDGDRGSEVSVQDQLDKLKTEMAADIRDLETRLAPEAKAALSGGQSAWQEMVSQECATTRCWVIATNSRLIWLRNVLSNNKPYPVSGPGIRAVDEPAKVRQLKGSLNEQLGALRWGVALGSCPVVISGLHDRATVTAAFCSLKGEAAPSARWVAVCQDSVVGYFVMRAEHDFGTDEDALGDFAARNCARGG